MSQNMVTVSTNVNTFGSSDYNGWTVRDIRNDALVVDRLNLSGDENVQVRRGGGAWTDAGNDTVVRNGDEVLFVLPVGIKG